MPSQNTPFCIGPPFQEPSRQFEETGVWVADWALKEKVLPLREALRRGHRPIIKVLLGRQGVTRISLPSDRLNLFIILGIRTEGGKA